MAGGGGLSSQLGQEFPFRDFAVGEGFFCIVGFASLGNPTIYFAGNFEIDFAFGF